MHRIGFDPPPIKEEKRLSGKLKEIISYEKSEQLVTENNYRYMQAAVKRITALNENNNKLSTEDQQLFGRAGNELAVKAIENPGKYLKTLQELKQLAQENTATKTRLMTVQNGLFMALPKLKANPSKQEITKDEINTLLLKELENL